MEKREQQSPKAARIRRRSILLVDDSTIIRDVYSEVLRKAGHYVMKACDGYEAQNLAEASSPFDLLLTDYQMPGMTGAELAIWLHQRWPQTGVLLVSASPEHLKHARSVLPFATCAAKTSSPEEFLATVAMMLERRLCG